MACQDDKECACYGTGRYKNLATLWLGLICPFKKNMETPFGVTGTLF